MPGLAIEPLVDKARNLPVMVFIHHRGFVIGSRDAAVQDGATFVRDGVVCVSINHRLGVDGFLPIPGVPTNLALSSRRGHNPTSAVGQNASRCNSGRWFNRAHMFGASDGF